MRKRGEHIVYGGENDIKDESDANDEDVTNIVVNIHVIKYLFYGGGGIF